MHRRPLWTAVVLFSTSVLFGCNDGYSQLGLIDVTGRVTLDDAPLAGARVRFEDPIGAGAEAITDEAGNYRLMYDSEHAGCPAGPKTVRITQAGAGEEGVDPDAAAEGSEAIPTTESLPAIYNRQSTIKADVSSSQRTFDFDLKSRP